MLIGLEDQIDDLFVVMFVGIDLLSKKQYPVLLSSVEAKYHAMTTIRAPGFVVGNL